MNPRRLAASLTLFLSLLAFLPPHPTQAQNSSDPWSASETIQVADLVKELADAKSAPTVLYVGFNRLYVAGHIKGALYHGAGNTAEGLNGIKTFAATLPKSTNLVLYCGCCPMEKCPNIRPAYAELKKLGLTNLHVLILPNSFAMDWAEKGLPYDKGA
jgi:thiosulfate/3-mercaptopyruvate sulfurtransferase